MPSAIHSFKFSVVLKQLLVAEAGVAASGYKSLSRPRIATTSDSMSSVGTQAQAQIQGEEPLALRGTPHGCGLSIAYERSI